MIIFLILSFNFDIKNKDILAYNLKQAIAI